MQLRILDCSHAIDFRACVKECAQEPEFIEYFNRVCGTALQAPIAQLLDDRGPQESSDAEQLVIGCFIMFVYENIWVRLRTAAHRTGSPIETETESRDGIDSHGM